jgi:hypothetical protein
MVQNLVRMEFFQLLFPFLLALAIAYGVLTWVFKGKLPNSAIGLISLIFAFFAMLYSSMDPTVYLFLTNISGVWLVVASAILFLIVILGVLGISFNEIGKWKWPQFAIALIVVLILVVMIFGATPFGLPYWAASFTSDLWTIIFFVVILAIVLYFLTKEKEGKKE